MERQIRQISTDLPPGYYRQLPKLVAGPFAGYPRVFGMAWAFVAHTDSCFNSDILVSYVNAYQQVQPLTIGELWAVSITLQIVLIENLETWAARKTAARRGDGAATSRQMISCVGQVSARSKTVGRVPIVSGSTTRLAARAHPAGDRHCQT